jgi:type II secretory pathway component PulJ
VSRLREQQGHTLVELLAAMSLMILVIGSTLGAFDTFGHGTQTNQKLNEAQDAARNTLDLMSRQLRNASAYANDVADTDPKAIVRADAWDIVFQSIDPMSTPAAGVVNNKQLQRVRYCLDTATNVLWRQRQTWSGATPAVPAGADCPAAGWSEQIPVASYVVNGGSRRVFTYNSMDPNDVAATPPALSDITSVRASLFIDVNGSRAPAESQLATGVQLRNKNRRPIVSCVVTPTSTLHASLNGTGSSDPEGEALKYEWYEGGALIAGKSGPVVDYAAPAAGARTFSLKVTDVGNLTATASCNPSPINLQ